ncbi:carboxypeptidase-like regulatory domain-containing protein [Pontibacter sp. FD36]|uniref:carboxypeptidase-like regulatory domain-containing protein n=1 Tax=Pontibacter sp. FD36 TaxID=2789860 RepID=UPI0018ABF723|nr:carboxypeptidase-like regulatory domain-containing protein [Pontibacter sp. FD36]MBF8964938.1 carboxypeptidase-like regulatory domain-containing protein [Pontibacter sp. FD36]
MSCNEDTVEPEGEGSIAGVVLDATTSTSLVAVSISTNPATSAIVTDAEGRFLIEGIGSGDYSITAKKSGYKSEAVNVAVRHDKQTSVTIILESTKEGNAIPDPASNPDPATEATNVPNALTLRWQGRDLDRNDTLSYDVYLFESLSGQKKKVAEAIQDTSVQVTELKYNTTYFWQVVSKDSKGNISNSDVWSFTTASLPTMRHFFTRVIDNNYDVYASDGTTDNTFRLTTSFAREWWPRLNPQRDLIAYSSNVGTDPHIFVMTLEGNSKRQVTTLPVVGYHNQGIGFTWSPDGGKLLYANYDKLYTINRDGSGLTLIATAPANRHFRMVDWTAQGNRILVQTIGSNINDSELYIMNANGSGMQQIVGNLPGRVESPSFSIDGTRIMYTVDASGFESADGRQLDSRIYIRNIDGTGTVLDVSAHKPAGTNDLYPRFSPDGARVIFVNTNNDGLSRQDVYTVELEPTTDVRDRNRTKLFDNATMPEWK